MGKIKVPGVLVYLCFFLLFLRVKTASVLAYLIFVVFLCCYFLRYVYFTMLFPLPLLKRAIECPFFHLVIFHPGSCNTTIFGCVSWSFFSSVLFWTIRKRKRGERKTEKQETEKERPPSRQGGCVWVWMRRYVVGLGLSGSFFVLISVLGWRGFVLMMMQ